LASKTNPKKWHKVAGFGDHLCHFAMPKTDPKQPLPRLGESSRSGRKWPMYLSLRRKNPPATSPLLAVEKWLSDRSGKSGTKRILCHRPGTCGRKSPQVSRRTAKNLAPICVVRSSISLNSKLAIIMLENFAPFTVLSLRHRLAGAPSKGKVHSRKRHPKSGRGEWSARSSRGKSDPESALTAIPSDCVFGAESLEE
jgi:hypothetical protein